MTKLTLFTTGALAADLAKRTLTGLLLPYNEEGRTNLGRLTVPPGVLHAAAESLPFYDGHKGPLVGSYTHEDTEKGIRFVASIFPGPAGDALLASGKECVSVEVDPIAVRDGRAISGVLTGAAAVEEGAFPSARLAAEGDPVVPDTETSPDFQTVYEGDLVPAVEIDGEALDGVSKVTVSEKTIAITTDAPEDDRDEIEDVSSVAASASTKGTKMTAAKVQNPALVAGKTDKSPDMNKLFATIATGFAAGETFTSTSQLMAALADIVPANTTAADQPQYIGQLWDGVDYVRRFIPLFNHADLTAQTVNGWRWKDGKRPEVDLYTGNKADIPTNTVDTEAAAGVLQRIAGGHDIDRIYRDFSNAEFWEAYFKAMTESYAKKSDRYVRDVVKAIPTAGNGGRVHLLNAAMPAGVPKALAMVVKGALKLLNSDLEVMPTFAMISASYWEELMYVPQDDVLAYLSASLSLKEGQVEDFKLVPVPDGSLTVGAWVGQVLVGHKNAVTVRELPGSPIRVEAEAIAKGGVDEALFGYVHTMTENAAGLVAFDAPTAA
jgi:hypothetical protein